VNIREAVPLKDHTTFKIGGPARFFTAVTSKEEAVEALAFAREKEIPFYIVGKGSNLLFDDSGFPGLVICNGIGGMKIEGDRVWAGAGYSFSLLGVQTARSALSGLEFASGIPGSVGGAVYMNAGAGSFETKDSLVSVEFIDSAGKTHLYSKEELVFRYRYSSFHEMKGLITSATFALTPDPQARLKQLQLVNYRTKTQPYSDPSAGCIFCNPPGESAGRLIEQCGLKGLRIGGAEVSTLHGNFIVNREGATASDVLDLVEEIKRVVKEKTGHELHMEVRRV